MALNINKFSKLKDKIQKEFDWSKLNNKQQSFCFSVLDGRNVFLSGAAGCGKSFVLNYLFSFLEKNGVYFGKTATTGIAALNIGGSTIHSFSGVGLANTDEKDIIKNVFRNKKARKRIESVQILFIDEISMCSGHLFSIIDKVFRIVRRNREPFGNAQIVISGDFLQLPYIVSDLSDKEDFAFNSISWKSLNFKFSELIDILRQKDDLEFAKILNEIRHGNLNNIDKIESRIGAKFDLKDGIKPVRLLGYNKSVENWNNKLLSTINAKSHFFYAKDRGERHHIDFFNKNCPSPATLELKIGCQVSLTYNINTEEGLVNGLVGKVVGFEEKSVLVKFLNGNKALINPEKWEIKEQIVNMEGDFEYKVIASRSQIPLRLAFAASIHRAQGSTLDYVEVDLDQVFVDGMGYSALSRVKNLNGLSIIKEFNPYKITANKKCVDFYKSFDGK